MTETEAIRRLQKRDISGLEELMNLYYLRAVRTAYLILQDRTQAEDVAQAAFLRVYERIDQFDTRRPFAPWFLRSVVNDARMIGRSQERNVPLESDAYEEHLSSDEPSPEELFVAAETNEAIWAVLDNLSVDHRAVIVRRYYLGLSEAEIASDLDCPPGTVKSRLHAARHRLRHLLPAWLSPTAKSD